MNRQWLGTVTIVAIAFLAMAPSMAPAQGRAMTTDELVKQSDVVVVGKVNQVKSEWSGDKSRIFTRVTLTVDQYLMGTGTGATLTLVTPGGEIDGVGEMYTHMPVFHKDEDVVVYAARDAHGAYRVTGGSQGKLMIDRDSDTGMQYVAGREPLQFYVAAVQKAAANQGKK